MRVLGLDFSGGSAPWRSRVSRPTVWIATVDSVNNDRLALEGLVPVQALAGTGTSFARLTALLSGAEFAAAGIDAPFSIPSPHIPMGGYPELLRAVQALPNGHDRDFPIGADLLSLAEDICQKAKAKPLRACEARWVARGVNTRSTLWNGPRGGAPFAAACIALIARSGRPAWPWIKDGPGVLVEAFPAAQLNWWRLPFQGYSGANAGGVREQIVGALREKIVLSPEHEQLMRSSPDALDAVLCAFAAAAVANGRLAFTPTGSDEGEIAIHE